MTHHTLPNIKHTPSVQAIGKHQRKIADDERASQSIYRRRVRKLRNDGRCVMQHLDFVIWLLLFPPSMALSDYLWWKVARCKEYSEGVERASAAICVTMWFGVAALLWIH